MKHLLLLAAFQCPDGSPPPCRGTMARAPAAYSVAVMYFENVTRDSADAYLADGLTEAIIVRLGQVGRLEVKSRGMSRQFRESQLQPAALGRQLGAAHLVSGSVRRGGNRLRVTVELVRSSTGVQLWAQQFDRAGTDMLAIEEDIANAVATAIAGRLLPAEQTGLARRPTRNPAAYDHFLRGNHYLARRTPEAIALAVREFEAAVRADPGFSAALARAAFAYRIALGWGWQIPPLTRDSMIALSTAAADRALTLDSTNSDAWLAKASVQPTYGRLRMELLDRAVQLDPRSDEARHQRGWVWFMSAADVPRAEADFRAALAIEPLRAVTVWYLALVAHYERRFAHSRALADSALIIDPDFAMARILATMNRAYLGEMSRARQELVGQLAANPVGPVAAMTEATAVLVEQLAADTAAMRRQLARLLPNGSGSTPARMEHGMAVAILLAHLGDPEAAVAMLRRTSDESPFNWIILQIPAFDVLQPYPPFQRFLESIRPSPVR